MAQPKKPASNSGAFDPARMIDDLVAAGMSRMNIRLNIIEFAEQILGVSLMVPQSAILKAFYDLPLDPDELAWLERMVAENKTTWRPGVIYTELDVEAGMRSTKTFLASIGVSYEFYELLSHDDPALFYGLAKGSPIFITTVATTQQQSKDTVFGYTTARITESPYFQTMRDKGEIIVKDERIECPGKRVTIIGGHSNQAGMVGKTAKMFCMDEAARFKDASTGQSNARSMYANVGRSTTTFKKNGRKFIISSAWEDGDIMEWLWDQADPNIPGQDMLAFRLCTWDINTTLTRSDFDKEYRQDEVAARRDYEGVRPGTVENFFNKQVIQQAVTGSQVGRVNKVTLEVGGSDNSDRRYVGLMIAELEKIKFGEYSYGHCDPGLKKDSFTLVTGHPVRTDSGIMAVIDLVLEWEPKDQGKGLVHQVSYENVEDIIRQVHAQRNLKRLCFDHWNSAQIIQRLYARGIITQEIFFGAAKQMGLYQTARQKFNAGLVVLPDNVPKAVKELIHIQLLRGSKIDHPKRNPDETPGCFTGDMKVSLLDGRELAFTELVEEFGDGRPFHVYSVDPATQRMQVGVARNPRLTAKQAAVVAVTLDNGEVVRCTPDHRFMLRDGSWCEAKDLACGVSLRSQFTEIAVISVEPCGFADVYDLTVAGLKNFALTAGVFVHNSKDLADAIVSCVAQIADDERGMLFGAQTGRAMPVRTIGSTHVAGLMGADGRTQMNMTHEIRRGHR